MAAPGKHHYHGAAPRVRKKRSACATGDLLASAERWARADKLNTVRNKFALLRQSLTASGLQPQAANFVAVPVFPPRCGCSPRKNVGLSHRGPEFPGQH